MLTFVAEYHNNKEEVVNDFKDVDQSKLNSLTVKHDGHPFLKIQFDDTRKKLIWFNKSDQHLVGWQMKENGINVQNINHIFEEQNKIRIVQTGKT